MTDWDKELAKIDKQLASISDEQLMASAQQAPAPAKGATLATKALPAAGRAAAPASAVSASPALATGAGRPWVSWLKVTVAVTAAAGLMFWPWPARCGLPLIGFTAATGGVAVLGLWSAIGTWRHRLGLAHVASLLVTMWGLGLGAREVLPRVGYAIPTIDRPAVWSCDGLPALPAPPSTVTPSDAQPGSADPSTPAPTPAGDAGTTPPASFPG